MKRLAIAMAGLHVLLGVAALLFNAVSAHVARASLTPLDLQFDPSLPGRTIQEDGLNADLFCGASDRPQHVVIVLGGSEGGKHWSANTEHLQAFLDHEYCVMVLAYFHGPGLPEILRGIPLEYFEAAFAWLARQPGIVPDDYALFGGSRGGELALLLASRYPQVRAVVALDPSSVVFPGSPQGLFDVLRGQHSAWSYGGQPLPFVPWPVSLENASNLVGTNQRSMFEQALRNQEAVEAAAIPVEDIRGPLLCISDTRDQVWPSTLMCDQIMARLDQHRSPFYHEHISFDEVHYSCSLETCMGRALAFLDEHFP